MLRILFMGFFFFKRRAGKRNKPDAGVSHALIFLGVLLVIGLLTVDNWCVI